MRKNLKMSLLALIMVIILTVPTVLAESPIKGTDDTNQVKLTDAQKKEVKVIYDQIWVLKKQLVEKYKSYGVIDSEKADKIIKHMAERKEKMEENGFEHYMEKDKKCRKRKH